MNARSGRSGRTHMSLPMSRRKSWPCPSFSGGVVSSLTSFRRTGKQSALHSPKSVIVENAL
eukprot:11922045-Heterocapsa_arctica.AAC.1